MQPDNIVSLHSSSSNTKTDHRAKWGAVSQVVESVESHVKISNQDGFVKIELTDEEEKAQRLKRLEELEEPSEDQKRRIMEIL